MKKIKINFIYSLGYQFLAISLPLITAPYISRILGADGVGIFSYTNSIVNYFLLAGMLGMTNLGNRSIAEVSSDIEARSKVFWNLYSLQFISFFIVTTLYVLYVVFCFDKYKLIALIQVFYLLGGMLDIGWLFGGLEEIKLTVFRNALIKVFAVCCIFIFVKEPTDIWKYALLMSLGTFLSQIYLWMKIDRYIVPTKPQVGESVKYIKPLFLYFIPVVAYSIYKLMDKVMLGNMVEITEVGYYENALRIVNVPMGIINALGAVMLPRITVLKSEGNDNTAKQYTELSIKIVTFLSSAICFGLISVSDLFAIVYFGPDFLASGPLIAMLSVTCFFVAWANVTRTQYLIPYKKDSVYIYSTILGAIINIIINFLLIPILAGKGAAIGTIVAEFTVMLYQIIAIRKEIPVYKFIFKSCPFIINGVLMLVVLKHVANFFTGNTIALLVQIIIGVIFYVLIGIMIMFITKDDLYYSIFKANDIGLRS